MQQYPSERYNRIRRYYIYATTYACHLNTCTCSTRLDISSHNLQHFFYLHIIYLLQLFDIRPMCTVLNVPSHMAMFTLLC